MKAPRVLMVCTGNTCRSPLAQVLLQGLRSDWEVASAGVMAEPGPASRHSQMVALERGLDLSTHQARQVGAELLDWADHVLCMTEGHRKALQQRFPGVHAETLKPQIGDPVGQPLDAYRDCADQLTKALQDWLQARGL